MRRRFPQPVLVRDLINLRVLDYSDVTIGTVRKLVRTPDGKIKLVVACCGRWFGFGEKLVEVPIEVVAIFGRQLASLDMQPEEYRSAAAWTDGSATVVPETETILIALTKR